MPPSGHRRTFKSKPESQPRHPLREHRLGDDKVWRGMNEEADSEMTEEEKERLSPDRAARFWLERSNGGFPDLEPVVSQGWWKLAEAA